METFSQDIFELGEASIVHDNKGAGVGVMVRLGVSGGM